MSELREVLKPGDIINTFGFKFDWRHPFTSFAVKKVVDIIAATQREVFGETIKSKRLRDNDTHTMMYFDPEHIITIVTPKPKWEELSVYENPKDYHTVTVYRMNPAYFGREIGVNDASIMMSAAQEIIDRQVKYDIGQLADILITSIAGYPWAHKVNWFDQGSSRLVCSVGCAAIIAHWRHKMKEAGIEIPQPWKKLNNLAWDEQTIREFPGHWEIDSTFPANYALTDTHFQNEFIFVGQFKNGKRIA